MIVKQRRLTLIVGCYGSGKTVQLAHYPDSIQLDYEHILDPLLGYRRKYYPEARKITRAMFQAGYAAALETGVNIAVTENCATRKSRKMLIGPAREHGYHISIIRMATPADECLCRCRADPSRPRTTDWRSMIEHYFRDFEPVTVDEYDEYLEIAHNAQ